MKSIVVMPVKNEDWILDKTLKALSLWADHIIIADQHSTDRTLEIAKDFPKVKVIMNEAKFHSSAVRKLLLDEARKIDAGNNLIFSFDADEIPTADIVDEINHIKAICKPGEAIILQWLNLWKSVDRYRDDDSIFSNSWKEFAFFDDRIMDYTHTDVINDHTSRVPLAALSARHKFNKPKVLHYQFSNWNRTMSKQSYYRMKEIIHEGSRIIDYIIINHRYYPTGNEKDVRLSQISPDMTALYEKEGIHMKEVTTSNLYWMDVEILQNMKKYGLKYFALLDIWSINWEEKRLRAIAEGYTNLPNQVIVDPRNIVIKYYHSKLQGLIDYGSIFYRVYKTVSNILN